jgi:hypothetical protein
MRPIRQCRQSNQTTAFYVLIAIAVIVLLAFAQGCSGLKSPAQRYERALSTYSALKLTLAESHKAGLISDAQLVEIEPAIAFGDRQIEILKTDYREGRPLSATALDSAENVIDAIAEWLAKTKARK